MLPMFENSESVIFSELFSHNCDVPTITSPKENFVAYAVQNQLVLRNLKSGEILTRFICDYTIDSILWSPDSELICCGMFKQNLIQVWSTTDPSWRCKISEGYLEISNISWSPDSKHLLVNCESNLKFTIWSLVSTEYIVLENPKVLRNGFSFSNCGKYLAILQRINFEDYISIFSCDSWQHLKCFPVEIENASEIHFSPSDLVIAVLSAFPDEYKVLFYSIDGRLINTYCKSDVLLGITSFCWSPKNNYIFIGDYTEQITILDERYKEICCLSLPTSIDSVKINFYRITEKLSEVENDATNDFSSKLEIYENVQERPACFKSLLDSSKTKQKILKSGIQIVKASFDGHSFAIISGAMPNVVFILNAKTLMFSDVVEQKLKIRDIVWHPQKPILAICTECSFVDLWTPTCCIRIMSPYESEFLLKTVEWCSSGDYLILNGKDSSSILKLP